MDAQANNGEAMTRKAFWVLVVVALIIYLAGNSRTAFFDRDEPRFAEAAREMLKTGDWVVPRFNGEVRYDKPILSYYPMALGMAVFGENEFGARFFNAIFGALSVVVLFSLAQAITGSLRTAFLAAAILAATPIMVAEAKQCTADSLLVFLVLLSFHGLWKIYEGPCGNGWKFAFWTALGLAVLTKGPVAIAAVFGAVFLLVAISRDRSFLGRMAWPWGVPLMALVILPWVMAVEERTGGEFLRVALGEHVVDRAAAPREGHSGPPGYYIGTAFLTFFPWAFFLPGAVWDAAKGLRDRKREIFLLSWLGGLWVILELTATKMMHYSLPVLPAAAILVADFLVRAEAARDRRLFWGVGGAVAMAVAIGAGLPAAAQAYGLRNAVAPLAAAGAVLLAGMAAWVVLLRRWSPFATAAGVAAVLSWLAVLSAWGVPSLMNNNPSRGAAAIVASVRDKIGKDAVVGLYGYREPSLVFYVGGARYAQRPTSLEELYSPESPDILVLSVAPKKDFADNDREFLKILQDTTFEYQGWVSGFNFAKGEKERLNIWSKPAAEAGLVTQ